MTKKKESISIAIVHIADREVFVKEPNERLKKDFQKDLLKLGININFSPSEADNNILLNVSIKYEYPYEDGKIELLRSAFSFQFEISNMDKIMTFEDDKIDMPDELSINLVSIALSTIRGLIAAKTQGYFINKFYFPVFNPKELSRLFNNENSNSEKKKRDAQ